MTLLITAEIIKPRALNPTALTWIRTSSLPGADLSTFLASFISSNVSKLDNERTNSGMKIGTMPIGIKSIGNGRRG